MSSPSMRNSTGFGPKRPTSSMTGADDGCDWSRCLKRNASHWASCSGLSTSKVKPAVPNDTHQQRRAGAPYFRQQVDIHVVLHKPPLFYSMADTSEAVEANPEWPSGGKEIIPVIPGHCRRLNRVETGSGRTEKRKTRARPAGRAPFYRISARFNDSGSGFEAR